MAHNNAVPPRTAQELTVIRSLHAAFMSMMRQFDADLQREHRLSHTEYVAMDWLSEAPDRTLGGWCFAWQTIFHHQRSRFPGE
jgi:hypothetical protein